MTGGMNRPPYQKDAGIVFGNAQATSIARSAGWRRTKRRSRPFGWCKLLEDYWPVDFAITAGSPRRHSVSARKPTFPDRPAEASSANASCHWDWHKFF